MKVKIKKYYYQSLLIRKFEKKVEELFEEGELFGTTHGYIGQEIIAVSLLDKIDINKDSVTGTHRSHGHYLALFEDVESLFGELMGRKNGVVEGKGGSQHLHQKNFYTNGITGGMIPVATGIALSNKLNNSSAIVVSFLGDGAMNEGYVFEAMNFSSVKKLPILFVLENNQYAMSTSYKEVSAGNFIDRMKALDIKTYECETTNLREIETISDKAINFVKNNNKPAFINFKTYRFCGHSKSDKCEYRNSEEESYWKKRDILKQLESMLEEREVKNIRKKVNKKIIDGVQKSKKSSWAEPFNIYLGGEK